MTEDHKNNDLRAARLAIEVHMPQHLAAFDALQAEHDRLSWRVVKLGGALKEISEMLDCDEPCLPERVVCSCGRKEPRWCAGCIARNALEAT